MELKFRLLNKDEIDVRVGNIKKDGSKANFLLYKDARVDMRLLDEVVGPFNWKRTHEFKDGKLYCTVSIYDETKKEWVSKEDVGVESNAEAEKGQASDSFKRACFNWGIGRELYTAPMIWIEKLTPDEDFKYLKLKVKHIGYDENGRINELIIEDSKGNVRFEKYDRENKSNAKKKQEEKSSMPMPERMELIREATSLKIDMNSLAIYYKHNNANEITDEELHKAIQMKKERMAKNG